MEADKITKLFQAVGAALALPAAAAGVYTVYRTNFSPDTACQNLRASIVSTMEKNVGLDAKKALLKKDVEDFNKNCGESDPAAREMFQAVLEGKASIGELSARAQMPARPAAVAAVPPVNQAASQPAGQGMSPPVNAPAQVAPQAAMPPVITPPPAAAMTPPEQPAPSSYAPPQPPSAQAPPMTAPIAAPSPAPSPQPMPAQQARPATPPSPAKTVQPVATGQAQQVPGQTKVAAKPPAAQQAETRGWVVLARREGIRRAEVYFDGFQFSLTSFPPPGTILTARVAVPILSDINQRPERGAPPAAAVPQGTVKQGACVKVLSTRPGIGRLWGEVVSTRC